MSNEVVPGFAVSAPLRIEPTIQSFWRGTDDAAVLWWRIEGEEITDRGLRNWCANNMQNDRYVDVVRLCHARAYANRNLTALEVAK